MLLRFSASNFLSIAAREEISFVASPLRDFSDGLLSHERLDSISILPSAIIYGANAAGKSNLIEALRFMKGMVIYSYRSGDPKGGVPRTRFALDPTFSRLPSTFEIDFIAGDVRYNYGFECDNERFKREWLYSYPEGKRRTLFDRNENVTKFSSFVKGPKKFINEIVRPNSLIISTSVQNNLFDFAEIYNFFESIEFASAISAGSSLVNTVFKDNKIDTRTLKFLEDIGTGVIGYKSVEIEVTESIQEFKRNFMNLMKTQVGDRFPSDAIFDDLSKEYRIELAHRASDGTDHFFDLGNESAGTRRLLLVLDKIFQALDKGSLIVIDEIDASLHTLVSERILHLFDQSSINLKGSQILATTHDTNLLSCAHLRRDQIWFCEKDKLGASHFFALSEVKSRSSDDFEKGYLQGRYGAIPFSGNRHSFLEKI
jgi:AAA15 family ATPase/GTPase